MIGVKQARRASVMSVVCLILGLIGVFAQYLGLLSTCGSAMLMSVCSREYMYLIGWVFPFSTVLWLGGLICAIAGRFWGDDEVGLTTTILNGAAVFMGLVLVYQWIAWANTLTWPLEPWFWCGVV